MQRSSATGYYVFLLDVRFSFGLELCLPLTGLEDIRVMINAKVYRTYPELKNLTAQGNTASKKPHQYDLRQLGGTTSARTTIIYFSTRH